MFYKYFCKNSFLGKNEKNDSKSKWWLLWLLQVIYSYNLFVFIYIRYVDDSTNHQNNLLFRLLQINGFWDSAQRLTWRQKQNHRWVSSIKRNSFLMTSLFQQNWELIHDVWNDNKGNTCLITVTYWNHFSMI